MRSGRNGSGGTRSVRYSTRSGSVQPRGTPRHYPSLKLLKNNLLLTGTTSVWFLWPPRIHDHVLQELMARSTLVLNTISPSSFGAMGLSMATEESDPSMDEYLQSLPKMHMEPLWTRMSAMVPPSPNPVCQPYLWRYSDCLPYLSKAGNLVTEQMAERRVLMLVNPAMKAPHTTDTIYGGLQLVNPGEVAPAHRHIAYAARFIIDGNGFTAVEGKKMPLMRGDVVVTPTWHWHDHGNESTEPVVWLDVLNLPLFTYARVNFAESYEHDRYPSVEDTSADWRHPWQKTQDALDKTTDPHSVFHYKDCRGRSLSTTIGVQAERVSPSSSSQPSQEVSSFLYHCYGGQGHTIVIPPNGEKLVFHWRGRDTFAVPAWSSVQHFNESGTEPAYLVGFHDRPFIDNLGLRARIPQQK